DDRVVDGSIGRRRVVHVEQEAAGEHGRIEERLVLAVRAVEPREVAERERIARLLLGRGRGGGARPGRGGRLRRRRRGRGSHGGWRKRLRLHDGRRRGGGRGNGGGDGGRRRRRNHGRRLVWRRRALRQREALQRCATRERTQPGPA